jgi:predicted ATP-dependent endonuclease of OLD family
MNAVVLVEGTSDRLAVETLARRYGRDLEAEGVSVVEMGGAHNIARFLTRFDGGVKLAGLCDAREERDFARALERAGLGSDLARDDLERLGFFVCEKDLEDELIRALGTTRVEQIAEAEGDISRFRTMQKQPEWRDRPTHDQLRRWLGSGGRRKIRYAQLLVEALELEAVPRPLAGVLAHVG